MPPPEMTGRTASEDSPVTAADASIALGYVSLAGTARKILQEHDLPRVLETICEEARRILGANRSLVARIGGGASPRREILYSSDYPQSYIDSFQACDSFPILAEVLRDKKVRVIPEKK